jgi:hypothetical protein
MPTIKRNRSSTFSCHIIIFIIILLHTLTLSCSDETLIE